MMLLGKGTALLIGAVLLSGCQSAPFTTAKKGCCCCNDQPTISKTQRDALWQKMEDNRAISLAAQPQGRKCTAHRCEHKTCRLRL